MSVLRRRRDQEKPQELLDSAESGLADNFDSPYHHQRIVPVVTAVSVVLAVFWLTFEAYNVPAIMKEGRLSPDDPTSYARIGELDIKSVSKVLGKMSDSCISYIASVTISASELRKIITRISCKKFF